MKTEKTVAALSYIDPTIIIKKPTQKDQVHILFVVFKKQNTKPKKIWRKKREKIKRLHYILILACVAGASVYSYQQQQEKLLGSRQKTFSTCRTQCLTICCLDEDSVKA